MTLLTAGDLAITEQPQSLTVPEGNSALFTVGVTGLLPITYQWQFNGSNIAGATDASFAVEDAQVADAGAYRVVVGNGYTTTASSAGTLAVLRPGPPCCTDAAPNLVTNGSFEVTSPAVAPNSNAYLPPLTGVNGWDTPALASGAFLEVWGNIFPFTILPTGIPAFAGTNHLELNAGLTDQTVFQVVTGLTPGQPATLCFDYTGRYGKIGATYNNDFTLTLSGGAAMTLTFNPPNYGASGWKHFSMSFIPTSSTVTIAFRGKPHAPVAGGGHIDEVSLTQPPQPGLACPANLTLQSPGGGIVVNDPEPVVVGGGLSHCTPPSGSVFPPGITVVTCTATNACGSASCSFTVTVEEVLCPGPNRVVNGSFESPSAAANDNEFFAEGLTGWDTTEAGADIEFWNGTFSGMVPQHLNQHLEIIARSPNATVSQVITGLSTNCEATLCFNYAGRPFYDNHFTLEIEGSGLAPETLNGQSHVNAGSWLLHHVTFTPLSSTVTIKFTVRGRPLGALPGGAHIDNVCLSQPPPPNLVCPADISVSVSGGSAVINYPAPVVTGGGLLHCEPASGSVFNLGTTPVTCIATNDWGTNACTFNVTVLQATCPTGVNLALNGSFESPTLPNNSYDYVSAVPNWATTDSQGEFELWSGSYGGISPVSGNQHLEINAHDGDATVSQVISNLDPTCPTTLCFAYTGR